ncbi:MAG: type IV toxin-antitoxin system AbiEi family antitoxin domain-containing protein [Propionicimonas sp.]|uniref:DUF559 domain-containing protein n=1 Tax=Propionicimonas sp. TaxID=1955623 RepID=UPI003D14A237
MPTAGRDLIALGASKHRLEEAVRDGRLLRVRRGVYLDATKWPADPREQHLVRACAQQAYQAEGVVSHRSAAAWWRIPLPSTDWVDEPAWLTLPAGASFRSERSPGVVQLVARLPRHQVGTIDGGFPVTTIARTAADLVRTLELPEALVVLDGALRLLCADLVLNPRRSDYRNQRLVEAARAPVRDAMAGRGMAAARRWLEVADPVRESPIESLAFGHMMLAGLPLPECQVPIATPLGTFFPDFYWRDQDLIGEADGRSKYADAGDMIAEKRREQVLRDQGHRFVRWDGGEIHARPHVVMARIGRALGL